MKLALSLLATLCAQYVSCGDEPESRVLSLSKDNFDNFLADNKVTLIEYFAPWCGHCKSLAPTLEQAAEKLSEQGIKIAKVDCTENTEICQKRQIRGYPTLKVYANGAEQDYQGDRSLADIVSAVIKATMPTVSELSWKKLDTFNKDDEHFIVGVNLKKDIAEVFEKFALEDKIKVASVNESFPSSVDGEVIKKFNGLRKSSSAPVEAGIYMVKKFDEGITKFPEDKPTVESLQQWSHVEALKAVDEVGPENYPAYLKANIPMGYLFYKGQEMRDQYGPIFEEVMKSYKGKYAAVYIDAEKFHAHAKALTLPDDKWPGFVIHVMTGDLKYPFIGHGDLTKANLAKFVEGVHSGKIEPTYRSQPVPEKNDAPVKTVVFKNFGELVTDVKKDVLLKIYAPWCGACKRLAPIYEDLAKAYAAHSDKIVIAKMDGTENDLPRSANINLTKFPTFILFKAGSNEQVELTAPVASVGGFVKFIRENAVNKVEVDVKEADEAAEEEDEEEDHLEL